MYTNVTAVCLYRCGVGTCEAAEADRRKRNNATVAAATRSQNKLKLIRIVS